MAQTEGGAIIIAARKVGISPDEYRQHLAAGEKWCYACRSWHKRAEFSTDLSRKDGLKADCKTSAKAANKSRYKPVTTPRVKGRKFVEARDGDREQARRRVNFLVESGLLPPPNSLLCTDCGHIWKPGEPRHEYDHYLGYDAQHHETVQATCSPCHHKREVKRGEN